MRTYPAKPMRATAQPQRTVTQHNAPGTPGLEHNEHHILEDSQNKTKITATPCNRLPTRGHTHGKRNSEHVVYTTAQDNGQPKRTRQT